MRLRELPKPMLVIVLPLAILLASIYGAGAIVGFVGRLLLEGSKGGWKFIDE